MNCSEKTWEKQLRKEIKMKYFIVGADDNIHPIDEQYVCLEEAFFEASQQELVEKNVRILKPGEYLLGPIITQSWEYVKNKKSTYVFKNMMFTGVLLGTKSLEVMGNEMRYFIIEIIPEKLYFYEVYSPESKATTII